jgi:hypothetical protein
MPRRYANTMRRFAITQRNLLTLSFTITASATTAGKHKCGGAARADGSQLAAYLFLGSSPLGK